MSEHGWVVCSPGDPNELQWGVIFNLAGQEQFCAREWNADTGSVKFTIFTRYGDLYYVVTTSGETRELETTHA